MSLSPQEAARGPAQLVHRGAGLLGPDAVRLHLAAHPLVHARGTLAGGHRLWTGTEAESGNHFSTFLILPEKTPHSYVTSARLHQEMRQAYHTRRLTGKRGSGKLD